MTDKKGDELSHAEFATEATRIGAEIIGRYENELTPLLIGFGALHAAIFSFTRAGFSREEIVGLTDEHCGVVRDKIRALFIKHGRGEPKKGDPDAQV